ncbi:centrosome-associated zinc finger protein CP190 isoform X2 [Belonocnema kinseyi]|nr:centrosome-associated zinc finger protein CP190 isoform X2 [Belonocnema kinseyi]
MFDGILVMPHDMPYECVKSIISFMYTGQLEYWTSEQSALYRTAQKMKMTVLTKLLDAQSSTGNLQANLQSNTNINPVIGVCRENARPKKVASSDYHTSMLPIQILPGRKLPIWKRKLDTSTDVLTNYDLGSLRSPSKSHKTVETTSGPSRFDLPEVEDFALGVFSSFEDITYDTKPIVQAPENVNNGNINPSVNSADHQHNRKCVEDETEVQRKRRNSNDEYSDDDWTGIKSILKHQEVECSPLKKVRFDFEEKENIDKSQSISTASNSTESMNNHAKIIKEVLKKYPHLVKNNKNIRLKIMQKEVKSSKPSVSAKTKVSYVVLKSDHLMNDKNSDDSMSKSLNVDGCETGPWKCSKCDLEEEYTNYYMYRRHMQDVHEQKFDPRVCEHCGYKATKRNILMYHLYTKHNVPPPKNMFFPKCHACSYVALSETLLVRHQMNHNHRPASRSQIPSLEGTQCMQCAQEFKDVAELASHEISTCHGTSNENKDKTHRCPHCGKTFVRVTNLHVHLDCVHKELRNIASAPQISVALEPSTEAEALSNVVSGIATSLGVNDSVQSELQINTSEAEYIVPEIDSISTTPPCNTQEYQEQHMLMLIDDGTYQNQENRQQEEEHLNMSRNEQIIMQGVEGDMIVYIQENDTQNNNRDYGTYHSIQMTQCQEEIVEEVVEELEEFEEVMESESNVSNEKEENQLEEEIQYVEEETEIVEYNDEIDQDQNSGNVESQESIMIIEEEQLDEGGSNVMEDNNKDQYGTKIITKEWDVDKVNV